MNPYAGSMSRWDIRAARDLRRRGGTYLWILEDEVRHLQSLSGHDELVVPRTAGPAVIGRGAIGGTWLDLPGPDGPEVPWHLYVAGPPKVLAARLYEAGWAILLDPSAQPDPEPEPEVRETAERDLVALPPSFSWTPQGWIWMAPDAIRIDIRFRLANEVVFEARREEVATLVLEDQGSRTVLRVVDRRGDDVSEVIAVRPGPLAATLRRLGWALVEQGS